MKLQFEAIKSKLLELSKRRKLLIRVLFALLAIFLAGVLVLLGLYLRGVRERELMYREAPYRLEKQIKEATWNQPADVAIVDERIFVLDTNNNRIVEITKAGKIVKVIDQSLNPQLELHGPMAIASYKGKLYVADSLASRILVLTTEGIVEKVIAVPYIEGDEKIPRPIGVAVARKGDIIVSDVDNNRVLRLDPQGNLVNSMGTGKREATNKGFNAPGGLAVDNKDNIYIVDILNGRVQKFSLNGKFMMQLGEKEKLTFFRPKGVAVDGDGNVYVTDGFQAIVRGLDPAGESIGVVGKKPGTPGLTSVFEAPAGIKFAEGKIYVVDRFAGLLIFSKSAK